MGTRQGERLGGELRIKEGAAEVSAIGAVGPRGVRSRHDVLRWHELARVRIEPLRERSVASMTFFLHFLRRVWDGKAPLWAAFWLVGVVGLSVSSLVTYGLLRPLFGESPSLRVLLLGVVVPNSVVVTYVCVGVWRCAPNSPYRALTWLARTCVSVFAAAWAKAVVRVVSLLAV